MRSEQEARDRLERHRCRLEEELQGSSYQAVLRELHRTSPFYRRFPTWADVIAFMRGGTSSDPRKDEILRPILQAHAEDGDPLWREVLLAVFWPGLRSIHVRKRGWDEDPGERWQNITWVFLQVLCRIDVRRRPDRLVQKIYNDTIHYLYQEYRRTWDRTGPERPWDDLVGAVACSHSIDFDRIALRETREAEIRRLREHMAAGRISEADFFLLIGTRVYGRSVADYAQGAGLDYQVAKKRRQRAEAALRRFGEQ